MEAELMKIIGFGKCSLDKIIKFENKIGFYLPKDYKEFILNQNGGYPEKKYATFKVEELNQEISGDTTYGRHRKENRTNKEKEGGCAPMSDDKKYWEEEVKIKNSSKGFNSNITGIRLGITKIEK